MNAVEKLIVKIKEDGKTYNSLEHFYKEYVYSSKNNLFVENTNIYIYLCGILKGMCDVGYITRMELVNLTENLYSMKLIAAEDIARYFKMENSCTGKSKVVYRGSSYLKIGDINFEKYVKNMQNKIEKGQVNDA